MMMEKEIALSNILTPVSVGLVMLNPITILTILSIISSIILNIVLIVKHSNKSKTPKPE